MNECNNDWWIFRGTKEPHTGIEKLPSPPRWRQFTDEAQKQRGATFKAEDEEKELVNAALYLRRPLLITGKPGTGKTSLAYAVARELRLGPVLRWSITTRSTLQEGLYRYDAIARLQDASLRRRYQPPPDIGRYLSLGPLGTAFAARDCPRVLLIDEIDKSDIDLPNDLLHVFEEGEFEIPELGRLPEEEEYACVTVKTWDNESVTIQRIQTGSNGAKRNPVTMERGRIRCDDKAFPLVILTSNGEREFPPAFLRRCLRLEMHPPGEEKLAEIVSLQLELDPTDVKKRLHGLIQDFLKRCDSGNGDLATDQLLNAAYLCLKEIDPKFRDRKLLLDALWKALSGPYSQ